MLKRSNKALVYMHIRCCDINCPTCRSRILHNYADHFGRCFAHYHENGLPLYVLRIGRVRGESAVIAKHTRYIRRADGQYVGVRNTAGALIVSSVWFPDCDTVAAADAYEKLVAALAKIRILDGVDRPKRLRRVMASPKWKMPQVKGNDFVYLGQPKCSLHEFEERGAESDCESDRWRKTPQNIEAASSLTPRGEKTNEERYEIAKRVFGMAEIPRWPGGPPTRPDADSVDASERPR
jgi:hypothetical protein